MVFTGKAEALPLKKRALRGRRLVVAEMESIAEGAVRTVSHASWVRRQAAEAISLEEGEQVIVGATHRSVLAARMAWPQSRILTGAHAEDVQNEILQVLREEHISERFDELVLASGNGVYAEAVASLGTAGVEVTAVAWPENLSRRLRMAVARVVLLERGTEILGGVG